MGSALCLSSLANKPLAVIKARSRIKVRTMLARVSLIGERLKSDEMARHGSMMVAFVFLGGGIVLVYWLFPDFIINSLFADEYSLVASHLFKYGLAMAFWAISFLLMQYLLSLNRTKVAYSLLGAMVLQVGLIIGFHSSIGQIVDIMLISSIACLALVCPFYFNVRRRHL